MRFSSSMQMSPGGWRTCEVSLRPPHQGGFDTAVRCRALAPMGQGDQYRWPTGPRSAPRTGQVRLVALIDRLGALAVMVLGKARASLNVLRLRDAEDPVEGAPHRVHRSATRPVVWCGTWARAYRCRSSDLLDLPVLVVVLLGVEPSSRVEILGTRDRKEPVQEAPRKVHPGYQFVAVSASTSPSVASQRSASIAALQPSHAAVTAWR